MSATEEFTPRQMKLGDDTITIGRFRGLKAIEAAAVMADIMRAVPEIQDQANEFVREFEEKYTITLTPAMANLPRFDELGLTRDDIAKEPGGTLTIPQTPTANQQLIHMLPTLFDKARAELTRLIGVVTIPNSDLEKADDEDNVQEATQAYGKRIVRNAYVDELAEVLVLSWQALGQQFSQREELVEALGELPFLRMLRSTGQSPQPSEERKATDEEINAELATLETERPESPISSTGSPPPMAGTGAPSSSASPGLSSSD